ncbi:MAG: hypothetical protein DMF83_13715 [Acidobacteria bacterium]|nr:MAG: hypothetical protein DMF83_13715 [Acidobacteriota bacterium]
MTGETTIDHARGLPRLGPKRPPVPDGTPGSAKESVPDDIQRWTARRRMALVLSVLKGEITVEEGACQHRLTVSEIEEWKDRMLAAAHNALRSRPKDADAIKDDQIRRLQQKVGELVVDVDLLKEALQSARSLGVDATED